MLRSKDWRSRLGLPSSLGLEKGPQSMLLTSPAADRAFKSHCSHCYRVPCRRELSKAKSGMAALKGISFSKGNCFWCRMRALGKEDDDDDVEGDFVIPGGTGQPRPGGLVAFREAALDAMEDVGVFRVPISRTDGAIGAVEIEITTQDGSANEVVDYKPPLHGRLRWEDGETDDKFVEVRWFFSTPIHPGVA